MAGSVSEYINQLKRRNHIMNKPTPKGVITPTNQPTNTNAPASGLPSIPSFTLEKMIDHLPWDTVCQVFGTTFRDQSTMTRTYNMKVTINEEDVPDFMQAVFDIDPVELPDPEEIRQALDDLDRYEVDDG